MTILLYIYLLFPPKPRKTFTKIRSTHFGIILFISLRNLWKNISREKSNSAVSVTYTFNSMMIPWLVSRIVFKINGRINQYWLGSQSEYSFFVRCWSFLHSVESLDCVRIGELLGHVHNERVVPCWMGFRVQRMKQVEQNGEQRARSIDSKCKPPHELLSQFLLKALQHQQPYCQPCQRSRQICKSKFIKILFQWYWQNHFTV